MAKINYEVIYQMFSAVLSQNESKERIEELRPQAEEAVKELRADMKRTAEKLAKAHPNSESIKHGFSIALMVN